MEWSLQWKTKFGNSKYSKSTQDTDTAGTRGIRMTSQLTPHTPCFWKEVTGTNHPEMLTGTLSMHQFFWLTGN